MAKNAAFSEEFLGKNDVEAVLATLCCYDYDVTASETVEKIVTDQKIIANASCMLSFAAWSKRIQRRS